MPTIPWEEVREIVDAVLDLPPGERTQFLDKACSQPSMRRYVESLILSYEGSNQFLDEPAVVRMAQSFPDDGADSWLGKHLGAYELVEEIGHGGMGSVYRAVRSDDEFRKVVAIKVVRGGFETQFARERFLIERQILSDLDHPNIAHLLEGGSTADGQPYFVMEYIEGARLDSYCDEHKLSVTERLRLFLTVCSAVQYAHQKLVIHRDIKPGNILVTPQAVPKLLDFGIAKILASDAAATPSGQTRTQMRMLTPEYASPEQRRGELISTASDVYSLGVVLYELLTGRSPYPISGRTPEEIDRTIESSEPQKPSTAISRTISAGSSEPQPSAQDLSASREGTPEKLRRRLKGDLDTILLKSLRKDPKRRYPSVEQLSEDIRRHLEGLPVLARNDTLGYRAGKFARRHSGAVAAAALVLVSLTTGLLISLREAAIARAQRARAEQRFNDVRALANSLLFDVYDSVEDLPGSTAARKLIVAKALHYLDDLSRESQGDAGLERELAAAYERIGDVQGNSLNANLGDSAGALASYQKAVSLRTALFGANPSRVDDAINFAKALRITAQAMLLQGETVEAWKTAHHSTEIAEQAEKSHPNDRQLLVELGQDYSAEADIVGGNFTISNLGDTSTAIALRQKQASVEEMLLKLDPGDAGFQRSFAVSLAKTGDEFILVGEWHPALAQFVRAQAIFEKLAGPTPSRKALDALQSIYTRVYFAQRAIGSKQAALETARRALSVATKLSVADANDVRSHVSLAIDYANLAAVCLTMNQVRQALDASSQAVTTIDKLVASNHSDGELPGIRASVYTTEGDVLSRMPKDDKWLDYFRISIGIYQQIKSGDPENAENQLQLSGGYNDFGKSLLRKRDFNKANDSYRKSLASSEYLIHAAHPSENALYTVAESYTGLGDVESAQADSASSRSMRLAALKRSQEWYSQSLKLWARVKEPGFLTPSGDDCVPPSAVKQRLAEVNSRLISLSQ